MAQTVQNLPEMQEDPGSIPGLGRSLGAGNGNPLQFSCLENPKDRGAWWATVPRVEKSWTQLSDFTFTFHIYIKYSGSVVKNLPANIGDMSSIPGSGGSPGGDGSPLQYYCQENSVVGGAWWATVHGVTKSWTQPSDFERERYIRSGSEHS